MHFDLSCKHTSTNKRKSVFVEKLPNKWDFKILIYCFKLPYLELDMKHAIFVGKHYLRLVLLAKYKN